MRALLFFRGKNALYYERLHKTEEVIIMKVANVIGGATLALLGAAWVKLYGEYKYACGRKEASDFYNPIVHVMGDQIKDLCEKLKAKEA